MSCVTSGETISNTLGLLSSVVWFFVLVPQLYQNYKAQDSDAVSLFLILLWLVGDYLSMLTAQVKGISKIVVYVAIYHIIIGIIFTAQIIYYRYKKYKLYFNDFYYSPILDVDGVTQQGASNEDASNERASNEDASNERASNEDASNERASNERASNERASNERASNERASNERAVGYYNYLLLTQNEQIFIFSSTLSVIILSTYFYFDLYQSILLADVVAWLTTLIFIGSRIPQIHLNYNRKSTHGLSVYSFVILNIANYLFLLSILVNMCDNIGHENEFLISNLQWIVGSMSGSLLDIVLFYQFYIYN